MYGRYVQVSHPGRPFEIVERKVLEPGVSQVRIKVQACGICHGDSITKEGLFPGIQYPRVPGHEVAGVVDVVGKNITGWMPGQRVAVGWHGGHCGHCDSCRRVDFVLCVNAQVPGISYDGGYADYTIAPPEALVHIPDDISVTETAPLLCAGITTWSPLQHWKVEKGTNVGVIGLGGLGHMALKLDKALGANVTLFTRSPGKEQDVHRLGADNVVVSTDANQMTAVNDKFSLIIDTVPYIHDVNQYMSSLSLDGTLVLVGFPGNLDEPPLNTVPLVMKRKSIAGSDIGGIAETQELLDFCGKHGITPDIEVIKIQDINKAYKRMLKSDVKYRFVIDMASLKSDNGVK